MIIIIASFFYIKIMQIYQIGKSCSPIYTNNNALTGTLTVPYIKY